MNAIPVTKFYKYQPHHCPNQALQLTADNLQTLVFKSLKFPIREKARKIIRLSIRSQDAKELKYRPMDYIFQLYATMTLTGRSGMSVKNGTTMW